MILPYLVVQRLLLVLPWQHRATGWTLVDQSTHLERWCHTLVSCGPSSGSDSSLLQAFVECRSFERSCVSCWGPSTRAKRKRNPRSVFRYAWKPGPARTRLAKNVETATIVLRTFGGIRVSCVLRFEGTKPNETSAFRRLGHVLWTLCLRSVPGSQFRDPEAFRNNSVTEK